MRAVSSLCVAVSLALLFCSCAGALIRQNDAARTFRRIDKGEYKFVGYYCIPTLDGPCKDENKSPYKYNDLTSVPKVYNVIDIAFAVFDGANNGKAYINVNDSGAATLKQGIQLLQGRGVSVFLSFGGADCNWGLVNEQNLDTVVESMVQLIQDYGFDGVDLDDEAVNGQTQEQLLVDMIKALKSKLPSGKLLTVTPQDVYIFNKPVPGWGGWNTYEYVLNQTGPLIDWIQVMFYDNPGDSPLSGYESWASGFHNGPVYWQGFSASKILLGLLSDPLAGAVGFQDIEQANSIVSTLKKQYDSANQMFGGVMLWCTNAESGVFATALSDCLNTGSCGSLPSPSHIPAPTTPSATPSSHHEESQTPTPSEKPAPQTPSATPTVKPSGNPCVGRDVGFYCATSTTYVYCEPAGHTEFWYNCGPGTKCDQTSPGSLICGN